MSIPGIGLVVPVVVMVSSHWNALRLFSGVANSRPESRDAAFSSWKKMTLKPWMALSRLMALTSSALRELKVLIMEPEASQT